MRKYIHANIPLALIILPIIFLVTGTLFSILASSVVGKNTLDTDTAILFWVNEHASPAFDSLFISITQLGGILVVTTVTIVTFLYLLYKKEYPKATLIAVGVGGAALIGLILKSTFDRVRPNLWEQLVIEANFSFPSGHAIGSTALALCIVVLLWRTKWRIVTICLGTVYILAVGVSRLYLGVHYPTDIIGGWLLSLSWVALITSLVHVYKVDNRKKKHIL